MNLKLISALALSASMLIGCSDDVAKSNATNVDANVKSQGTITLTLKDSYTGNPIPGVYVKRLGSTDSLMADSLRGVVSFVNVQAGSQVFLIADTAKKIAPILYKVNASWGATDETPVLNDISTTVDLYSTGAIVKGEVFQTNSKGIKTVSAGVKATLTLNNVGSIEFVNKTITATTDANGIYSFTMPANAPFTINFEAKDGLSASAISGTSPVVGQTLPLSSANYNVQVFDIVKLSDNLTDIKSTDSLVFTFNQPVDQLSITPVQINVDNGSVLTTQTWSADKKSLTIKPYSGVWTTGSHFVTLGTVKNELKLTNSVFVSGTFTIKNESSIPDLSLAMVYDISASKSGSSPSDSTSSSIRLKYPKIPSTLVGNISIYAKEVGVDSLYEEISAYNVNDTTLEVGFLDFRKGKTYNFVLKVNNDVTVKSSPVLTVKYIAP